jgi:hypothetical protein
MTPWRFDALDWIDSHKGRAAVVSAEYVYADLVRVMELEQVVEIDGDPYRIIGIEAFMSNPPKGPYGLLVRPE